MMASVRLTCLAVVVAACARGEGESGWRGSVDTLPNGAVLVRNERGQVWDSATAWRLMEDLRIGSAGEGPASFSQIGALEVDPFGRIYVVDLEAQEIRVFDSTGAFVRKFGRGGKGPGEFVRANGLAWDPQSRLWVVDQRGERYTLFDTTGHVVATHPRGLAFYGWAWRGVVDTAGRLLEDQTLRRGADETPVVLRFDQEFRRTDTFPMPRAERQAEYFTFRRGSATTYTGIPFAPEFRWRLDSRGHIWFGTSDNYRILERSLEGDTIRILERRYRPIAVSAGELDSVVARLVNMAGSEALVDRSRIPRGKPAFRSFYVDDAARLWVLVSTATGEPQDILDVFDSEGRYLGRVALPFSFSPYQPVVIRADRLYSVTEDADGVPYVVRARIARGRR